MSDPNKAPMVVHMYRYSVELVDACGAVIKALTTTDENEINSMTAKLQEDNPADSSVRVRREQITRPQRTSDPLAELELLDD